jgi:MOSC domain-containing protein YiiM
MKVLSLNVGLPRKVLFNGQTVTTGIFKDPVKGPIMIQISTQLKHNNCNYQIVKVF